MNGAFQFDRSWLRKWSAVCCILLFAAFAFVQVAHFHPSTADHGNANSPDRGCSLCLALHCVAALAKISAAPVLEFASISEIVSDPQLVSHLCVTADFIRPPPPIA